VFISIALSRVAPVLVPIIREALGLQSNESEVGVDRTALGQVVDRFGALAKTADRECKSLSNILSFIFPSSLLLLSLITYPMPQYT
jgi:hypothetical protein